jgi:hypothetical protein
MKNIHLIPTDKPSRLGYLTKKGKEVFKDLRLFDKPMPNILDSENQHIYITSDEEIKIDEYYLGNDNHIYCLVTTVNSNGKKIILTTDQDLIADGVQVIDDTFLQWFVKNPSCEMAHVVYDRDIITEGLQTLKYGGYRIIIPKEESKQETRVFGTEDDKSFWSDKPKQKCEHIKEYGCIKDICTCNTGPKQETLEEAALSFLPRSEVDNDTDFITGFEFGAKWQSERVDREIEEAAANLADPNICKTDNWIAGAKYQAERMYSEEEVSEIAKDAYTMGRNNILIGVFNKWFNQFKKK